MDPIASAGICLTSHLTTFLLLIFFNFGFICHILKYKQNHRDIHNFEKEVCVRNIAFENIQY